MDRRSFLVTSSLLGSSLLWMGQKNARALTSVSASPPDLFSLFQEPGSEYRPFVRWWWNGNKVSKSEITRELKLLKEAGIGGVEINPISFPSRADDMGIRSLRWLSDEWIDTVKYAAEQAKELGMTADLIVGSGWPFGSEDLSEEETAQVVLVYAEEIEGPTTYQVKPFHFFSAVDPGVTDKNALRNPELLALKLAKNPIGSLVDVTDLSDEIGKEKMVIDIPEGKHVLYALVKFNAFAAVINGAPGAAGSILNHMDREAVTRYLHRMSDTMQQRIGPLKNYLRALFTDSMELEGSNWTADFAAEFKKRCSYDLMPYLPFILFKVGRLGAVVDEDYGAKKTDTFNELLSRVRFDYEFTKACILKERFTDTYVGWCRDLGVKSRAQAYGRGFFPLESSLDYDIPEGESWTTNYLRHKLGEEMSNEDYRRGRGYTMIDKYVSSAAHLKGKRVVSCEEMTNTYLVFNATLELLKRGSDQAVMAGITHSVWHGFNYSPKEAPFPGWIQYGSYYSEKNNWWPYFKYLNDYKARLSSQLQNGDYFADIAILPANYDLWANHGVQTDPFPEKLNVPYTSLLWEAINKNGGSADYITEIILDGCTVSDGKLCYGKREYSILFLPGVASIAASSLEKIHQFVQSGGRVYCIERLPEKGLGLKGLAGEDVAVKEWVSKLQAFPQRFVLLDKPADHDFLTWYTEIAATHDLPSYLRIAVPNSYFMQIRYLRDDDSELFFFQNAHRYDSHVTDVVFTEAIAKGRTCWIWDLEKGERSIWDLDKDRSVRIDLGPSESLMLVFDKHRKGSKWNPIPMAGTETQTLDTSWELVLRHQQESTERTIELTELVDFKDREDLVHFSGTAVYRKNIRIEDAAAYALNLGRVEGIADVYVNGKQVGVKWFGRRLFDLSTVLETGDNLLEIHVVTTMGNYLKTLTDNEIAQFWVNRKGREQEIQSMGMIGPVTLYKI